MMDHSFLCVLGLFWLYTLLCTGHTQGAVLTIDPNWSTFYTGESVTFICDMKEGTNTDWKYRILKDGREFIPYNSNSRFTLKLLYISYKDEYQCCGRLKTSHDSKCSNKIFLNVRADKPRAEVTAGTTTISVGGSVTLSCSVDNSAGWKYQWFRRTSHTSEFNFKTNDEQNRIISVSQGGIYRCRGERGDPAFYSDMSHEASINITFSNQVVVTRQPDWPQIFSGEKITLTCEIQGGETTEWMCVWRHLGSIMAQISSKQLTFTVSERSSGDYQCQCKRRDDSYSSTKWSEAIRLSVSEDEAKATLTADSSILPAGGSVTLTCSLKIPAGFTYNLYRNNYMKQSDEPGGVFKISEGGKYTCRGFRRDTNFITSFSNTVFIQQTVSMKSTVVLQPSWTLIYRGETITARCEIQEGGGTQWTYEWRTTRLNRPPSSREHRISRVTDSGDYSCRGRRDEFYLTQWSDVVSVTVSEDEAKATLTADGSIIPAGGSVTLTCSLKIPAGVTYNLYRNNHMKQSDKPGGVFKISEGGKYTCRGFRRDTNFFTSSSNTVFIQQTVSNRVTVTLQPSWTLIYRGETITARCEIQEGGGTQWTYEWSTTRLNRPPSFREHRISRVTDSGDYSCRGRRDEFYLTRWSDVVSVTVSASKPRARLAADSSILPAGGSVTLTCSVDHSADWKFNWFRDGSVYPAAQLRNNNEPGGVIRVSQGGLYRCRGGRGEPVFYTEDSHVVTIEETLSMKPTVVLQPSWTLIYRGETITVRCEIQEGGGTQWTYEWSTTRLNRPPSYREHRISRVTDSGDYSCRGRRDEFYLTQWSDVVSVTVSDKPRPVLSVSPSWLSPGSSVTLRCEIKPPSAGWRFYWYKAVPDLLNNRYSYDLLPGSTAGTEHDSYIIHGQTHTAGYVCRAGRGDTEYHTDYSEVKFLWSADVHPAASLTVNPDRVQHFTSDSVSLNCGGNSTKWRVMRFTETHHLSRCSSWGRMTGSSCNMNMNWYHSGVYWCESGSGEFSNTVNITVQNFYDGVILVSPVHPVTEGASVSLSCRRRKQNTLSSVSFYHNDKLLQHDGREELNISAVSQSDEGFYKCQHAGKTSQQSWMSVTAVSRPESSSFPVLLMVGSVIGIILLVFLLLLCLCKRSKDLCCIRWIQSQSSSQSSSSHPGVNQNETNQYSSPLHDADESRDGTYSLIELKHFGKKRRHHEPEESCVYSEVKTGTAESTPVYAEINHENKGKAKRKNKKSTPVYAEINHENKGKAKRKNKRKWSPAAGDAAVYSEVGLGAALDNNAAM
ncbi:Fc receptor-like protein 5 isoform X4 [Melanotaenia boesemani]|uniref:Fc receptor-like protein 5 isoform X4 n=1 Tax=Melanotaenia boesemani TaxID=1250792 RepID=UPI001C05AE3B|nr:Fc receptor-like protein 5 isoform X4 [Melanotaenia boesemani]